MLNVILYVAGKAFHIKEITKGSYFYPKEDGQGEISATARALKDGELVRETLVFLVGILILYSLRRPNGYFWMGYCGWITSFTAWSHGETDASNLRECWFTQPL